MKRRKQSHMVLGIFLLGGLGILTVLTFRLAGISVFPRAEWTVRFGADAPPRPTNRTLRASGL